MDIRTKNKLAKLRLRVKGLEEINAMQSKLLSESNTQRYELGSRCNLLESQLTSNKQALTIAQQGNLSRDITLSERSMQIDKLLATMERALKKY